MPGTNAKVASEQTQKDALSFAKAGNLPAALSLIADSGEDVDVSQEYTKFPQALYQQHRDLTKMLEAARAGIQFCSDATKRTSMKNTEKINALKNNAKVIAFNAAANCWPGWGDEGAVIEERHMIDAVMLADQSLNLVRELNLGDNQIGSAYWLKGALFMALKGYEDAGVAFEQAEHAFSRDGDQAATLMVKGYRALLSGRVQDSEGAQTLEYHPIRVKRRLIR